MPKVTSMEIIGRYMDEKKSKGIENVVNSLQDMHPGTHCVVVYPDLSTLRKIYAKYVKNELGRNRIVLMLPYYETEYDVRKALSITEARVNGQPDSSSLFILDSFQAFSRYHSDSRVGQKGTLFSLLNTLKMQEKKLAKEGISLIVDLGSLLSNGGFERLTEYERYISEICANTRHKQICFCHQRDFEAHLTTRQQANLLDYHTQTVIMMEK